MNKKGFIATSVLYSFFIIFITLFITIILSHIKLKVYLNYIETGIKENVNKGMDCSRFKSGDEMIFKGSNLSNYIDNNIATDGSVLYYVYSAKNACPILKIKNVDDETEEYEINMKDFTFIKEPSDSEYYIIKGVKLEEVNNE